MHEVLNPHTWYNDHFQHLVRIHSRFVVLMVTLCLGYQKNEEIMDFNKPRGIKTFARVWHVVEIEVLAFTCLSAELLEGTAVLSDLQKAANLCCSFRGNLCLSLKIVTLIQQCWQSASEVATLFSSIILKRFTLFLNCIAQWLPSLKVICPVFFKKSYLSSFNINKQTSESTVMLIASFLSLLTFQVQCTSMFCHNCKKAPPCKQHFDKLGFSVLQFPKVFDLRKQLSKCRHPVSLSDGIKINGICHALV